MRKLIILIFVGLLQNAFAQNPIADAGANQTIYLTQTNSVTLKGMAINRSFSKWREVSTDYSSGAKILHPNSLTTQITGLPQGVFYFELKVTSPTSAISVDTVLINVDYDVPPANSTLITRTIWSDMAYGANLRDDTIKCFSWSRNPHSLVGKNPNSFYMEKDGTLGSHIDVQNGKYYSTILDGHGCSGYGRSELIPARHQEDLIDTNKTYLIEWKGYFPQPVDVLPLDKEVAVFFQIHGNDDNSPPFSLQIKDDRIYFVTAPLDDGNNTYTPIYYSSDMYNQTHTIRMIIKEGMPSNGNFVKIEIDGVQKILLDTGRIGHTFNQDWIKGATLYDWANCIVDAKNHTRGKKYSLVTESFKIYSLSNTPLKDEALPTEKR